MIKRAERLEGIVGFGIDRVAASAEETGGSHGGPVLRMENLDTDLPLPPEALEVTREKLDDPKSNSWLPFTGDLDLRAALRSDSPDANLAAALDEAMRIKPERHHFRIEAGAAPAQPRHMSMTGG